MHRIYCILLFPTICFGFDNDVNNALGTHKSEDIVGDVGSLNGTNFDDSAESEENPGVKVSWATYIALLIKVSREQLENVKHNIRNFYNLNEADIELVDKGFNNAGSEYEHMLQQNLKKMVDRNIFNESQEFMLEFTDLSNFIVEQLIEMSLEKVNGNLLLQTKWYKQVMRQKIVRQQAKIATNAIEVNICDTLSICKEWLTYSEYLIEFLRNLLNVPAFSLKNLFSVIPDLLEKHKHTIKGNVKFRKTVKYIVSSGFIVQRDILDYLDEVLTDKKNVVKLVPGMLKKGATLLIELFQLIDDNYRLNVENKDELNDINTHLSKWIRGENDDIKPVLEAILLNMDMNLKIMPFDVQIKVQQVWSKIINL